MSVTTARKQKRINRQIDFGPPAEPTVVSPDLAPVILNHQLNAPQVIGGQPLSDVHIIGPQPTPLNNFDPSAAGPTDVSPGLEPLPAVHIIGSQPTPLNNFDPSEAGPTAVSSGLDSVTLNHKFNAPQEIRGQPLSAVHIIGLQPMPHNNFDPSAAGPTAVSPGLDSVILNHQINASRITGPQAMQPMQSGINTQIQSPVVQPPVTMGVQQPMLELQIPGPPKVPGPSPSQKSPSHELLSIQDFLSPTVPSVISLQQLQHMATEKPLDITVSTKLQNETTLPTVSSVTHLQQLQHMLMEKPLDNTDSVKLQNETALPDSTLPTHINNTKIITPTAGSTIETSLPDSVKVLPELSLPAQVNSTIIAMPADNTLMADQPANAHINITQISNKSLSNSSANITTSINHVLDKPQISLLETNNSKPSHESLHKPGTDVQETNHTKATDESLHVSGHRETNSTMATNESLHDPAIVVLASNSTQVGNKFHMPELNNTIASKDLLQNSTNDILESKSIHTLNESKPTNSLIHPVDFSILNEPLENSTNAKNNNTFNETLSKLTDDIVNLNNIRSLNESLLIPVVDSTKSHSAHNLTLDKNPTKTDVHKRSKVADEGDVYTTKIESSKKGEATSIKDDTGSALDKMLIMEFSNSGNEEQQEAPMTTQSDSYPKVVNEPRVTVEKPYLSGSLEPSITTSLYNNDLYTGNTQIPAPEKEQSYEELRSPTPRSVADTQIHSPDVVQPTTPLPHNSLSNPQHTAKQRSSHHKPHYDDNYDHKKSVHVDQHYVKKQHDKYPQHQPTKCKKSGQKFPHPRNTNEFYYCKLSHGNLKKNLMRCSPGALYHVSLKICLEEELMNQF